MNTNEIKERYNETLDLLLAERNNAGFWTGQLSSSALATAVAICAIKMYNNADLQQVINKGCDWLMQNINSDGSFGDTPESPGNISTSLLCYAAIYFCAEDETEKKNCLFRIENYLGDNDIEMDSNSISTTIIKRYGKDYTFSLPIVTLLTICGVTEKSTFNSMPQLPFEFSILPVSFFKFINLHVVSYAMPALIAVGITLLMGKSYSLNIIKALRRKFIQPALKVLQNIMPESGGFLEAIPLTGFVNLCLNYSDIDCPSVKKTGLKFLLQQQRADGSWPIDTDLSTWVTTLSVKAIGNNDLKEHLKADEIEKLKNHLLNLQYKSRHPFNKAHKGGWGWTNHTGSVPDADDTAGAIIALLLSSDTHDMDPGPILLGCKWLLKVQNRDGGIPTFCKGMMKLPFDSSCTDLTGHAVLAFALCVQKLKDKMSKKDYSKIMSGISRAIKYLHKTQYKNGSWIPLWFGNQYAKSKQNPVYGTSKVTIFLSDVLKLNVLGQEKLEMLLNMVLKGRRYLLKQQNEDGSWGGEISISGSIEETSLAVSALATKENEQTCLKGLNWIEKSNTDIALKPKPIGLYFAQLWYDEKLYPLIYYTEALRRYQENT